MSKSKPKVGVNVRQWYSAQCHIHVHMENEVGDLNAKQKFVSWPDAVIWIKAMHKTIFKGHRLMKHIWGEEPFTYKYDGD